MKTVGVEQRFCTPLSLSKTISEKLCVELLTRVDSVCIVLASGTKTLTGDTEMNEAQTAAARLIEAGEVVGFRFVDHAVEVGQYMDNSFVWDGDEKTDTELPGTCAFESWSTFAKYAQYSRGCGKCVVITGSSRGRGTDFAGEIYIGDAVVVAVMEW